MSDDSGQAIDRGFTEYIISAIPFGIGAFFAGLIPIALDDARIWEVSRSINDLVVSHIVHHLFVVANSNYPPLDNTTLIDHMGIYAIPFTFLFGYVIILVGFYYSRKEFTEGPVSKRASAQAGSSIFVGYVLSVILASQIFTATLPGAGSYAIVEMSANTGTAAVAGAVLSAGYGAVGGIIGRSVHEDKGNEILGGLAVLWLVVFFLI